VKRRYGKSVRDDVIHKLVGDQLDNIVKEQAIKPASAPQIELLPASPDQVVQCEAIFEVYPEFKLASLKGVKIERAISKVTSADVDKMLEKMLRQHAQWQEVNRPAKAGDKLVVDFVGKLEGKEFEGGSAKDVELELGSKQMIPGFEEGLIGTQKDKLQTLSLSFPKDYHAKELAGKSVQFDVTVHKISAAELPEINDEFVKKFGVKEGGEAALRKDIEENMHKDLEQRSKDRIKQDLMKILVEKNSFDIPTSLVDREIQRSQEEFVERMGGKNKNLIDALPREHFEEKAIQNVKLGLLFSEAIESFDLKVDENRVLTKLEEFAASYEHPSQMIELYKTNPRSMDYFRSNVLEEQVVEKFLEDVQLIEKQLSYDEFMNPKHKEA
jgi:trigger factor